MIAQVVVVSGETGCGKTTQLPQYILESEIDAARGATCSVICTQPRRISAMSVSERVAAERGEKLGESVSFFFPMLLHRFLLIQIKLRVKSICPFRLLAVEGGL